MDKIWKITRIIVLVFLILIFLTSCYSSNENYIGSFIEEDFPVPANAIMTDDKSNSSNIIYVRYNIDRSEIPNDYYSIISKWGWHSDERYGAYQIFKKGDKVIGLSIHNDFIALSKQKSESQLTDLEASESIVPDWLYKSMLEKFNKKISIDEEDITFVQVNLKQSENPQIAAYVTIDRINGYFLIFEYKDNEYIEVFSLSEPIYGIQVFGGGKQQLISFNSGLGGTGVQENYFHLIGYSDNEYQELWTGIAEKNDFRGEPPYYKTLGSFNLSMDNKSLLYSKIVHVYNNMEIDLNNPDDSQQNYELFVYDEQLKKFIIEQKE